MSCRRPAGVFQRTEALHGGRAEASSWINVLRGDELAVSLHELDGPVLFLITRLEIVALPADPGKWVNNRLVVGTGSNGII